MKTEHLGIILAIVIFWILATTAIAFGYHSAYATDAATVSTVPSVDKARTGEQFTIDILVTQEGGLKLAGMQADLSFNPQAMRVDNVVEGGLFRSGGQETYFGMFGESGGIDNSVGRVNNIVDVLIGAGSVSVISGVFCTLECTALEVGFQSNLALEDVIVGDMNGVAVPLVLLSTTQVTIVPSADMNKDGQVNVADLILIAQGNVPYADLNLDGQINVLDMIIASREIV